jgi:hypothetical protein
MTPWFGRNAQVHVRAKPGAALRYWSICPVLCVVLLSGRARAYHDEHTRSLEGSAYVLNSKEWLLGPLDLGVGLWRFQLSTRTMPWILGASLRKLMPNVELDYMALDRWGVTLTVRSGFYYVDSRNVTRGSSLLRMFIIPLGLSASWRVNEQHTVSMTFKYVHLVSDTHAHSSDVKLQGGGLADNAQLQGSWEMRMTRVSALLVTMRYLAYQADPIFQSDVQIDPRTTGTVDARVDLSNVRQSVAASVAGVFSWEHFNLRAGITYGALFLAGPGLVLPLKYPYPDINLYWRL